MIIHKLAVAWRSGPRRTGSGPPEPTYVQAEDLCRAGLAATARGGLRRVLACDRSVQPGLVQPYLDLAQQRQQLIALAYRQAKAFHSYTETVPRLTLQCGEL